MSVLTEVVDELYVMQQIEKSWKSWNTKQRASWCVWHDLPVQINDFQDINRETRNALFVEYLDNASKDFE